MVKNVASELKIYNSLNGRKEKFKPINEGKVGMYVCGPTVYNHVHLGNCRTFITFDMVYRYLKYLGYDIRYVRNITDAGHLTDDADEGEDKISKKARLDQLEPMEVVQQYTLDFHNVLRQFNNIPPSIEPTATGHIVEQIEIVKALLEKGFAYEKNGSVYFDVLKFNETHDYGKLSGRQLEDMVAATRELAAQSDKKNPQDFALWKKAEAGHIMRWPSPWGEGFPGWHLECTVMSSKYLGEEFDLHGGGMDLKFPHHECEIAQGEAANGKSPVRYWMHGNMLTLEGRKMSKSTGNSVLPHEIFSGKNQFMSKAYSPTVLRFFMMQAHYRSILDISDEAIQASEKGFDRLVESLTKLESIVPQKTSTLDIKAWLDRCHAAMNDDFNTPQLIAEFFEAGRMIHALNERKEGLNKEDLQLFSDSLNELFHDVLGLTTTDQSSGGTEKLDAAMDILIDLRAQARAKRDWGTSDQIRDRLLEYGIQLKDGPDGTTYTV